MGVPLMYLIRNNALVFTYQKVGLQNIPYRQVGLLCPILHIQMDAALEPMGVDKIFMAQKVFNSLCLIYHNL